MIGFKTRIVNEGVCKSLYELGFADAPIGHIRLERSPIKSIYSNLNIEDSQAIIRTNLIVTPHNKRYSHMQIPANKLKKHTISFKKLAYSPSQILLQHGYEEHEIKKIEDESSNNGSFLLESVVDFDKPENLVQLLNQHGYLLECLFPSLYEKEEDTPQILYGFYLESDEAYAVGGPSQPRTATPNSNSDMKALGELERKILITNPRVGFNDIGGNQEAKKEMERLFSDIVTPENAALFGRDASETNGYLISGESGSGKTLLVKALATKLIDTFKDKIKFYSVNYSDITSTYRGGEAKQTAKLFELVRMNEEKGIRSLMFLDEIQSVGVRQDKYNEALNTLLIHLDGISEYKGLTFIGATYTDLDVIDPALKRRLRNQIRIPNPNHEGRIEMLNVHINKRKDIAKKVNNKKLFKNVDLDLIAQATEGFNGFKIARLIEVALQRKEDEVRSNLGSAYLDEDLKKALTPINTQFILDSIPQVKTEGVGNTRTIGFF